MKLATLDWRQYIISDGGNPPYYITRNIPLAPAQIGQFLVEMSVSASCFADAIRVKGNYRIFDAAGQQIADQRGIEIRYSNDLEKFAERWIDHYSGTGSGGKPPYRCRT